MKAQVEFITLISAAIHLDLSQGSGVVYAHSLTWFTGPLNRIELSLTLLVTPAPFLLLPCTFSYFQSASDIEDL